MCENPSYPLSLAPQRPLPLPDPKKQATAQGGPGSFNNNPTASTQRWSRGRVTWKLPQREGDPTMGSAVHQRQQKTKQQQKPSLSRTGAFCCFCHIQNNNNNNNKTKTTGQRMGHLASDRNTYTLRRVTVWKLSEEDCPALWMSNSSALQAAETQMESLSKQPFSTRTYSPDILGSSKQPENDHRIQVLL